MTTMRPRPVLDLAAEDAGDGGIYGLHFRNLIRLYDPGLEQPGALKELAKGIENGASQSKNSWVQSNTTKRHRRNEWNDLPT
jgi:hypothetical protein